MFADLLNSSYFALFLIVALGFMLGRIKIKGLSLDVSATSVMVVGFVNSGMMKVRQAIGVIMGAILGTSVTGWILCLNQVAADGRQVVSHAGGGGVSAVCGAEGIVDKNVSQAGKSLAQLGIVLGLALDEPGVLQQHDLALFQGGGLGVGIRACDIGGHDDLLAQQLRKAVRHDLQAQLFLPLALGLAHVGAEDDLCAVLHQITDGGKSGDDPLVGSDLAVLGGDVEVAAAQNPLAGYINILNRLFVVVHDNTSIYRDCSRIFP